jgi:hypothetical protein
VTPEQIALKRELDHSILYYVREIQSTAAIRAESIEGYIKQRRLRADAAQVRDRIADLVDRDYLHRSREWVPGEGFADYYTVTAEARQVLDQEVPWDWERA